MTDRSLSDRTVSDKSISEKHVVERAVVNNTTLKNSEGNKTGTRDHTAREFPMTEGNFTQIQQIAYRSTGINLSEHKKEMIYSRLARRIRKLGLSTFDEYCALLEQENSDEQSDFINAITTNLTAFFREPHHFEFLKNTIVAELKVIHQKDHRVRIWSAGCSTGEEPYSIAMTIKKELGVRGWDTKILATDLDSNVLNKAKSGFYETSRLEDIDTVILKEHFIRESSYDQEVKINPDLQHMIRFKRLNLLEQWPMKGPFDVIFCRNVVIYFDKITQRNLFDRYAEILSPNGYLFIGHSESLHRVSDRFRPIGKTMYQKIR